ncbi:MAG: hypothetical protein PHP62_00695 [Candidatus Moranbacteria bacterium]|nr:hypothetical protein [Candidatus Moranbacteria bacterium]
MSLDEKIENKSAEKNSTQSEHIYSWKEIRTAREPRETQTQRRLFELKKNLNEKTQSILKSTKIFLQDHWNLLIKSAAHNHLRIEKIKVKPLQGEQCNLNFTSYSDLKRYQKKLRLFTFSFSSTLASVLIVVMALQIFFPGSSIQGATYTWAQNTWTGGADEITTATHNSNKTGWTKYFSKDANIAAGDDVKLASTSGSIIQTSDTDFNAGEKSNIATIGSGDVAGLVLLKPDGASCTLSSECSINSCLSNICRDHWLSGPCGITDLKVYDSVISGLRWMTTAATCVGPQCTTGLDTSFPTNYSLVADNAVDFSAYPIRNACKDVGGRLPTVNELYCIMSNNGLYGRPNYYGIYNPIPDLSVFFSSTQYLGSTSVRGIRSNDLTSTNIVSTQTIYKGICVKGQ